MQNDIQKRNGSNAKHEGIAKGGAVYRKRKKIL